MKTIRIAAGFMAVATLLAGCNCGGPSEVERFCEELAGVQCDHEITCGWTSSAHRDECIARRMDAVCGRQSAQRAAAGYSRFDSEAAATCLNESRARVGECSSWSVQSGAVGAGNPQSAVGSYLPTCGSNTPAAPSSAPPACATVFTAASPTGAGCVDTSDCIENGDGCGGSTCPRTCQSAGTLGAPCGRMGCDPGLYCDRATLTCVEGGAIGEECSSGRLCGEGAICDGTTCVAYSPPQVGDACESTWSCGPNLYCDSSSVCAAYRQENESCSAGERCAPGLRCWEEICQPPGDEGDGCSGFTGCRDDLRCLEGVCAKRLAQGEACRVTSGDWFIGLDYVSCIQCDLQLSCDMVVGTCEAAAVVASGEPCTGSTVLCGDGELCRGAWVNPDGGVGQRGACDVKRLGDPCASNGDCPEHAYCELPQDGGVGVCAAAFDGSPCFHDDECALGQYCEEHRTCRNPRSEGAACDQYGFQFRCEAGLVCTQRGSEWTCYRRRAAGESCDPAMTAPCLFPLECVNAVCQEAAPKPTVGDGQPCGIDAECASGWCELGLCQAACR